MDIVAMVKGGQASPLLLLVTALIVGALHGLEPGHSKTMMAAFMIAVRGTVGQAVLLGISATVSHSIIVWVVGISALIYGRDVISEAAEPWFLIVSGLIIWCVAGWVLLQTVRSRHPEGFSLFRISRREAVRRLALGPAYTDAHAYAHAHAFPHAHVHWHGREMHRDELPDDHRHEPVRFHDHGQGSHTHDHGHGHDHGHAHGHGHDHAHGHAHDHGHGHSHNHAPASRAVAASAEDAHARAHARDIKSRFASGKASTTQTILFGLTGGLIPCPAAITVLILCLNVNAIGLGVALVFAFSVGLALTLVTAGVVAAIGVRFAAARSARVDTFLANAPYLSASVIALIGAYFLWSGVTALNAVGAA